MNRTNTQLPEMQIPPPPKVDWFSKHYLLGYAFLALAFIAAVLFIYQMQYSKPKETQICIDVITKAMNPYTGETKEFPTPCEIPKGWEKVETPNHTTLNLDGSTSNTTPTSGADASMGCNMPLSPVTTETIQKKYVNTEFGYSFSYSPEEWEIGKYSHINSNDYTLEVSGKDESKTAGLVVHITATRNMSEYDNAFSLAESGKDSGYLVCISDVMINGESWSLIDYGPGEGGRSITYVTKHKEVAYFVSFIDSTGSNTIMSSFKLE